MITFATADMVPALKLLWQECFGDGDGYINFYYDNRFRAENTLVWLEHGVPAAMLTMLSAHLRQGGALVPVQYLYAVATRRQARGKGLSTLLLEHATGLARQRGAALSFLIPASAELFHFYSKRGYTGAFSIKTVELTAQELLQCHTCGIVLSEISATEYKKLRDAHFDAEGYVCWDEGAIAYALAENRFQGGFSCKISSPYGQSTALCYKIEDKLFIRETTLADDALILGCAAIAKQHGCATAQARVAAGCGVRGALKAFGMASKPLATQLGYVNLILD